MSAVQLLFCTLSLLQTLVIQTVELTILLEYFDFKCTVQSVLSANESFARVVFKAHYDGKVYQKGVL